MIVCECGKDLPVRLLKVATSFEHACDCGRIYVEWRGEFVLRETVTRPTTDYDRLVDSVVGNQRRTS